MEQNKISESIDDNCDVSNKIIDFSLKNHAAEAFSHFIEYSVKSYSRRLLNCAARVLFGIIVSIFVLLSGTAVVIKFFGIENSVLKNASRDYIATLLDTKNIVLKSASLRFDKNNTLCLLINGLVINNATSPNVIIRPSCWKSILHGRFIADTIEITNANIDLLFHPKSNRIYIKNNAGIMKEAKNKFISIAYIKDSLNKVGKGVKYVLSNANIVLHNAKGNHHFKNVSGTFDSQLHPRSIKFDINLNNSAKPTNVALVQKHNVINAYIKDAGSEDLSKFIREKNLRFLLPVASLVENAKLPLSAKITFVKDGEVIKCKDFDISTGSGSISSKNNSILSTRINQHIDRLNIVGTFNKKYLVINDLDMVNGDTYMRITGIKINPKIGNVDGTLELRNITKSDLVLLPKQITELCMGLLDNKLSDFKLSSLKMDINGKWPNGNGLDISHGIFEIKDGILTLGNKTAKHISASGEILKDKIKLDIHSAQMDGNTINNGTIILYPNNHTWNGHVTTMVPTKQFIHQLNVFKKCSIPFDKFNLSSNAKCNLIIKNGDHGLKIISGEGVIKSKDSTGKLSVLWDQDKAALHGTIKTNTDSYVSADLKIDLKNDTGEKKLTINSNNDVLHAVNSILGSLFTGKYIFELSEQWNGARGKYDVKVDLKGTKVILPIIGSIKTPQEDGQIVATASIDGDMLRFSSIKIDTNTVHLKGNMTVNRNTNEVISCNFSSDDNSVTCNIKRVSNKQVKINLVGKYLDLSHLMSILKNTAADTETVISAKVDNVKISDIYNLRGVKGRITVKNNRITNGGMYSFLSDGSSVLLDADTIDNSAVVTINVANAGQFLKEADFTDSVIGGKMKMTAVSDLQSKNTMYAINCELSDVLVKNSKQLAKLISLSTSNNVDENNFLAGFNGIVCSLTATDKSIIINDGKAIGPMLCISFGGNYDRLEDNIKLKGIAVPVNFYANGKSVYSPYLLSGALSFPEIAVNPMSSTDHNLLFELFGVRLFDNNTFGDIQPAQKATVLKPQKILEERYIGAPVNLDRMQKSARASSPKKRARKKSVSKDNNLGITVTRGV